MKCRICGESNYKNFYSSNKSRCKECVKFSARKYREDNKEKVMEYDRNRPNKEERVKKNIDRIRSDPEKLKKYRDQQMDYVKRNRHKSNARQKLARALLKGKVKRANNCEHCGIEDNIQGHHYDYNKPLDVIWLCSKCHANEHIRINNEKRKQDERD
jgi:hypothetical protein